MAFAGNQGRIAVPRSRIRRPKSPSSPAPPSRVRLLLPRALLLQGGRRQGGAGQQETIIIPAHMIVSGVSRVRAGQENMASNLGAMARQGARLLSPFTGFFQTFANTWRHVFSFMDLGYERTKGPQSHKISHSTSGGSGGGGGGFSGPLYRPHGKFPQPYPTTSPTVLPKDRGGRRKINSIADQLALTRRPNSIRDQLLARRKGGTRPLRERSGVKTFRRNTWKGIKRKGAPVSATKVEKQGEKITRSNYWKLPYFSTASNSSLGRAFRLEDRDRAGSWVPGRPGPLVWGDLEDKLEGQQNYYLTKHKHKLKITAREP